MAFFDVDAAAAQAFLPGDAFEVVESAPGTAQLLIALIDYEDNDLGDYLEVGLTLFVRPAGAGGRGSDGTFIVHLPVDQAFTREAGRTIWGFPKTVQEITRRPRRHVVHLDAHDGRPARAAHHRARAAAPTRCPTSRSRPTPTRTASPTRTPFSQGGTGSRSAPATGVELELGDHPIAKELARPRPARARVDDHVDRATCTAPSAPPVPL